MNGALIDNVNVKPSCLSAFQADRWVVVDSTYQNRNFDVYTPPCNDFTGRRRNSTVICIESRIYLISAGQAVSRQSHLFVTHSHSICNYSEYARYLFYNVYCECYSGYRDCDAATPKRPLRASTDSARRASESEQASKRTSSTERATVDRRP